MSRRGRRRGSRREFKRTVREKTLRFFELHAQGFSRETIAVKLDLTLAEVDELLKVVEEPEQAIVSTGGRA